MEWWQWLLIGDTIFMLWFASKIYTKIERIIVNLPDMVHH